MTKSKNFKIGILIIGLVFILLYFSIQLGSMSIIMNNETIRKKSITPTLSTGKSVLVEWYLTWDGGGDDCGSGVAIDSSNNIYLSGFTESFGAGQRDLLIVKFDGNGVQQWNHTWGGDDDDGGYGVAVDSSSNIYLAGDTCSFGTGYSNMILLKYNEKGVLQWNQTWSGGDDDYGCGIAIDSSSNIYLAGYTSNFGVGDYDMALVKYDQNGIQLWNRTWGGVENDYGFRIAIDSSSNIYIAGSTSNFGAGLNDMVLVKYDQNGMQLWNRTWGGGDDDYGFGIAIDSSSNVYVTGYTWSFGAGGPDILLVKYDPNGLQQWNRTWGGTSYDEGYGVAVESSGNVYVTGYTSSFGAGGPDILLVKYDRNGLQQWNHTWGGDFIEQGYGIAVDSSDNVYLVGETYSFGAGDFDMVLVKYSYIERPSADDLTLIPIIIVSIATLVGVGIAITYFIRKRWKIVE